MYPSAPDFRTRALYLPASLLALKTGGLPLLFGMTVFAGAVEITIARLMRPLRPFMPPEIAGFVVAMPIAYAIARKIGAPATVKA